MCAHEPTEVRLCTLPGNTLSPAHARKFVRTTIAAWTDRGLPAETAEHLVEDATLLASELVTNAVIHAGTTVELRCHLAPCDNGSTPAFVLEVSDFHPARPPLLGELDVSDVHGRGLQLVRSLAQAWGVSYGNGLKTIWVRLTPTTDGDTTPARQPGNPAHTPTPTQAPTPERHPTWNTQAALSFLAEASDLLAGQFDEDKVAALAGQLVVPRLAQWCAIWLEAEGTQGKQPAKLVRVWHADESLTPPLRALLEAESPQLTEQAPTWPTPLTWPPAPPRTPESHAALSCQLVTAGRRVGTLILGHPINTPGDELTALIADFARRTALALTSARTYTQHANTSRVLQQGLLPTTLPAVPHMDTHVVYEPVGEAATAGGDFYDLFKTHDDRWCFALGDICGHGPEAAVVIGLIRPLLKVLAEDGYGVPQVLDRINRVLLDQALPNAEAAIAEYARPWDEVRSLSLLYGELTPQATGIIDCTLASAGHPLPLILHPDGTVRPVADPQLLLGVLDQTAYTAQSFTFSSGDTLLCVTDGVTERRSEQCQFDDDDGLARTLSHCAGLGAAGVAEQIRQAVHNFGIHAPHDDLALLVLRAR